MFSDRHQKLFELLFPAAFAILWGVFAIWLRSGRTFP
jgi:hypothetical protein